MRLSGESPQPIARRPRAQSVRDLDGRGCCDLGGPQARWRGHLGQAAGVKAG